MSYLFASYQLVSYLLMSYLFVMYLLVNYLILIRHHGHVLDDDFYLTTDIISEKKC